MHRRIEVHISLNSINIYLVKPASPQCFLIPSTRNWTTRAQYVDFISSRLLKISPLNAPTDAQIQVKVIITTAKVARCNDLSHFLSVLYYRCLIKINPGEIFDKGGCFNLLIQNIMSFVTISQCCFNFNNQHQLLSLNNF